MSNRLPYASFTKRDVSYAYKDFCKSHKYHRFYKIYSRLEIVNSQNQPGGYMVTIHTTLKVITGNNVNRLNDQETTQLSVGISLPNHKQQSAEEQLDECIAKIMTRKLLNGDEAKYIMCRKLRELVELYPSELNNCHRANATFNIPEGYGATY